MVSLNWFKRKLQIHLTQLLSNTIRYLTMSGKLVQCTCTQSQMLPPAVRTLLEEGAEGGEESVVEVAQPVSRLPRSRLAVTGVVGRQARHQPREEGAEGDGQREAEPRLPAERLRQQTGERGHTTGTSLST